LVSISLSLSALPGLAAAQAASCRVPDTISVPPSTRSASDVTRIVPINSYVFALSWSPQFCRSHGGDDQCNPANGQFGFIVHGLWPQGQGNANPQWCPAAPLPLAVVRAQFCATPSARLTAHEWERHGACASGNPADYFLAGRKIFGAIRFPDMNALSRRVIDVGGFKRILSAANPLIQPSAIVVLTDRNGGWLREVQFCLARNFFPQPCPRGSGNGAPDGVALNIWRDGA
jgi:ribonuclease T2